jgi:Universal stress protein family
MRHDHEKREGRTHLRTPPYLRLRSAPCGRAEVRNPRSGHARITTGQKPKASARPVIVAGFDGTRAGREAVLQAGRQAGAGGFVVVVYAYRVPHRCLGRARFQQRVSTARANGKRALEDLFSQRHLLPESTYLPELTPGPAGHAIARIAGDLGAEAIVLGMRRARRFSALPRWASPTRLLVADVPVLMVAEDREPKRRSVEANASRIPDVEAWW